MPPERLQVLAEGLDLDLEIFVHQEAPVSPGGSD
jgi:hypothetical protein